MPAPACTLDDAVLHAMLVVTDEDARRIFGVLEQIAFDDFPERDLAVSDERDRPILTRKVGDFRILFHPRTRAKPAHILDVRRD